MLTKQSILILDFGSQYTQLIARRIREANVYSEIHPHTYSLTEIKALNPAGIILSGGPMSVYDAEAPHINKEIFNIGIPILGVCYGLQLIANNYNGKVEPADDREYGKAKIKIQNYSPILRGIKDNSIVWMSHGDLITKVPDGFSVDSTTDNTPICVLSNEKLNIYGLQFHPEVAHTEEGKTIINNFLFDICGIKADWTPSNFIKSSIENIKSQVGNEKVICALSGGVDSSVAAILMHEAIGENLICIHIDSGMMRKNESADIIKMFEGSYNLNLISVDASEKFISRLEGVFDPEKKRKIIGATFIDVFEEESKKFGEVKYLVQGTLYPDVIESVPVKGQSVTIKTHHNVGGLPEKMNLKLIEPFRELFKDEVRAIGKELGLPIEFIRRHPFPGPGLAVRIIGDITKEKLNILREADQIFIDELHNFGIYDEIWQAFAVLLPIQSVGVMGDARTYENVLALRAVTSVDGMTADWYPFKPEVLESASNKIIRNVPGINRVVYDVSSKPPATIEWE
ncbi:MAG: glutamine-hydrolyzing GMP synthase [Bacteroidetes bacterium]|nr:glutamine-hydrolyzing GMP synthase [Bacteroidota bacterium]MBU1115481.1 glutamine-hydrolyzing GMP synthase [Bacteroidota bacterium]MBU1798158.1 glutamine-hydrolyzing GMP synthase [Bacteroidota bacterium]